MKTQMLQKKLKIQKQKEVKVDWPKLKKLTG